MTWSLTLSRLPREGVNSKPHYYKKVQNSTLEEKCSESLAIFYRKKFIDHVILILHEVKNLDFLKTYNFFLV